MQKMEPNYHCPVLLDEVLNGIRVQRGGTYIDATLGDAGHALQIVKRGGRLLGIDRDKDQIRRAEQRLEKAYPALYKKAEGQKSIKAFSLIKPILQLGNFSEIKLIAEKLGFIPADGILFDLGVSSFQLNASQKGLTFSQAQPLDMRLDTDIPQSAEDLVNKLSKEELYEIFIRNAQEELAWPIAEAIISSRSLKPVKTTAELMKIICSVKKGKSRIHPATKVFLALRMEVNREIENLKKGLNDSVELLKKGGKLAVISFHETEDRVVKNIFKTQKQRKKLSIINKKPILPEDKEIKANPRSRSARMRIAERI